MPLFKIGAVERKMSEEQFRELVAEAFKILEFIMNGNMDWKNIRAEGIEARSIKANTITADKMNVTELSAITANLGEITAGSLTTNAEINVGTNATIGNILYLKASDSSGQKGVIFNDDGSFAAEIRVLSGDMSIDASGFIAINPGSSMGVVVNGNLSASSIKKGATEVALSGVQTGTAGPFDGGIPIGATWDTSAGPVTWTGLPSHSHPQRS